MKTLQAIYRNYVLNEEKFLGACVKFHELFLKALPYLIIFIASLLIGAYFVVKTFYNIELINKHVSTYGRKVDTLISTVVSNEYYRTKRDHEVKLYYGLYSDTVKFKPEYSMGGKNGTKVKDKKI